MKVTIPGIKISAIGTCVPSNLILLDSFKEKYGFEDIERVSKTTGIFSIRETSSDITTSDLCVKAAKNLITNLKINPDEIDGIVFVSQTGDFKIPQTSHLIQDRLGLKPDTICFDLPIGCNGYIYGLFQASLLIQSHACNKVLVLAGDTNSKIINEKDRSVKLVFGDGGSATLIERNDKSEDMFFSIYSDGSGFKDLIIPAGGCRSPRSDNSKIVKEDKDGNIRSENDLYMDGMAIFNFAINKVPSIINETLDKVGWNKDDVDLFALHQANKFMIDYLRKKTKVLAEKMPVMIDGFGNTGSASIPILLSELYSNNIAVNCKKVILCGFGVGLSWGTIACDLSNTYITKPDIY